MNLQATVGAHHNNTIHTTAASVVITLAYSKTSYLAAIALTATRLTSFPVKQLRCLLKRFWHVGTGKWLTLDTPNIAILRRVDLTNFQSVDA